MPSNDLAKLLREIRNRVEGPLTLDDDRRALDGVVRVALRDVEASTEYVRGQLLPPLRNLAAQLRRNTVLDLRFDLTARIDSVLSLRGDEHVGTRAIIEALQELGVHVGPGRLCRTLFEMRCPKRSGRGGGAYVLPADQLQELVYRLRIARKQ